MSEKINPNLKPQNPKRFGVECVETGSPLPYTYYTWAEAQERAEFYSKLYDVTFTVVTEEA